MAERRWRLDLAAWGFLVLGLVLALSVLSHDAGDGPWATVYPENPASHNLLGPPGALLGGALLNLLGLAAYVFLAGWFVLVVILFLRRRVVRWSLRLLGWVVLVPCAAVGADFLNPYFSVGPISGNGGTLGGWLAGLLQQNLSPAGRAAVYLTALALALFLAADGVVLRGLRLLGKIGLHLAKVLMLVARWMGPEPRPVKNGINQPMPDREEGPGLLQTPEMQAEGEQPASVLPPPGTDIPIRHHDQAIASLQREAREEAADALTAPIIPASRAVAEEDEERFADYELPPLALLEEPQPFPYEEHDQRLRERAALLEKTFADFDLNVRVMGINTGPVITQYEVALETGLRVHKVTSMSDDLALNLKVPSVRIVAPIPGKNTVGIEIPNEHRAVVRLKEVILASAKKAAGSRIPLFLGKDTEGRPLVYDLAEMPHLLIAGRTGTGKSVCMNAIILSILMTRRPNEVKMIMIDPKMLELSEYGRIPHLMHPVVKDMKKAEAILAWAVDKMEERYELLSRARVRGIAAYNELSPEEILRRVQPEDEEEHKRIPLRIPYIVIFVDEMNDLMMTMKKEVEGHIVRLAQKSRAAGIHLVVATQKPTVDIITGLIKSNLPARICFQVASRTDSRVVLDEMGAEKLLGKGDMLFLQPGTSTLLRSQGTYASDEEITRVVEHLHCEPCYAQELVQLSTSGKEGGSSFYDTLRARDEVYEQAIEVVIREGRGSVSLLQRALGIGYGRAARLIDFMAEDGIVGDYNGSQAREVLYTPEQWEQVKQAGALA
jgi:S-DNA-T family DNA segregation ATPase FtsK/SpoIIIE